MASLFGEVILQLGKIKGAVGLRMDITVPGESGHGAQAAGIGLGGIVPDCPERIKIDLCFCRYGKTEKQGYKKQASFFYHGGALFR